MEAPRLSILWHEISGARLTLSDIIAVPVGRKYDLWQKNVSANRRADAFLEKCKLRPIDLRFDPLVTTRGKYRTRQKTGDEELIRKKIDAARFYSHVGDFKESTRIAINVVQNVRGVHTPFHETAAIIADCVLRDAGVPIARTAPDHQEQCALEIVKRCIARRNWPAAIASIGSVADRNILADQAYNAFSAFPEDAMVRIEPGDIRKKGRVPKNGSLFFTIFQTFMSGPPKDGKASPYFGEYPRDFFDFIVIDECHRGGANDESNWRGILDYFQPAVQLGLTATPKRAENADTYAYFGDPVYIYSLKDGINDGFLTPFKVKQISTTLDEYVYTADDTLVEGEIEEGKRYAEPDFNKAIEIREREANRVMIFMNLIKQNEKTLVFCATQDHALAVRDLINQMKTSKDPNYCQRVTANDGALGEQHLRDFQDNEKSIPTILTTSQKLSTGVDARNIRNIVLMRPINSMIEFKQIIGRGTRLYDGSASPRGCDWRTSARVSRARTGGSTPTTGAARIPDELST